MKRLITTTFVVLLLASLNASAGTLTTPKHLWISSENGITTRLRVVSPWVYPYNSTVVPICGTNYITSGGGANVTDISANPCVVDVDNAGVFDAPTNGATSETTIAMSVLVNGCSLSNHYFEEYQVPPLRWALETVSDVARVGPVSQESGGESSWLILYNTSTYNVSLYIELYDEDSGFVGAVYRLITPGYNRINANLLPTLSSGSLQTTSGYFRISYTEETSPGQVVGFLATGRPGVACCHVYPLAPEGQ